MIGQRDHIETGAARAPPVGLSVPSEIRNGCVSMRMMLSCLRGLNRPRSRPHRHPVPGQPARGQLVEQRLLAGGIRIGPPPALDDRRAVVLVGPGKVESSRSDSSLCADQLLAHRRPGHDLPMAGARQIERTAQRAFDAQPFAELEVDPRTPRNAAPVSPCHPDDRQRRAQNTGQPLGEFRFPRAVARPLRLVTLGPASVISRAAESSRALP